MTRKTILLTGGAGYIGSHTAAALFDAGYQPVLLDNFSNSQPTLLKRLEKITGSALVCERGDVQDSAWVQCVLQTHQISAVVHFASLKAVGESMSDPLKYYRNNVGGTVSLLDAMQAAGCRVVVFSSGFHFLIAFTDRLEMRADLHQGRRFDHGQPTPKRYDFDSC